MNLIKKANETIKATTLNISGEKVYVFNPLNNKIMKKTTCLILFFTLLVSCEFSVEKSVNSDISVTEVMKNYQNSNFKEIYNKASISFKTIIDKEVFLNVSKVQEQIHGKIKSHKLISKDSSSYNGSLTTIYIYEIKTKLGDSYTLSLTFLKGHLLKSKIDQEDFKFEPIIATELVVPIKQLWEAKDYESIYNLLHQKYPLENVQKVIQDIYKKYNNSTPKYKGYWIDNDKSGKMMLVFEYSYKGIGNLDYRFFINSKNFPLAGIFYDETLKEAL